MNQSPVRRSAAALLVSLMTFVPAWPAPAQTVPSVVESSAGAADVVEGKAPAPSGPLSRSQKIVSQGFVKSVDVPKSLTDAGLTSSTITIPGNPRIADIDVSINLTHANMPDLDVHLRSPAGNDNGLFTDIGTNTQTAMDLTLDDEDRPLPRARSAASRKQSSRRISRRVIAASLTPAPPTPGRGVSPRPCRSPPARAGRAASRPT